MKLIQDTENALGAWDLGSLTTVPFTWGYTMIYMTIQELSSAFLPCIPISAKVAGVVLGGLGDDDDDDGGGGGGDCCCCCC